jgi:hypothetical protein
MYRIMLAPVVANLLCAPVLAQQTRQNIELIEQDPRSAVLREHMIPYYSRSATENFRGTGPRDSIVYGQFKSRLLRDSSRYIVRDLINPKQPRVSIERGDYGVAIVPHAVNRPILFFPVGQIDRFEVLTAPVPPEYAGCWRPTGREAALFVGVESAGGIIHYRNGWRWRQCGD